MLQIQYIASNITITDQTACLRQLEFIVLNFQALNKPKIGTSLCDVTMTLQWQEKIGNIFFLKQDTFFYKKMYV